MPPRSTVSALPKEVKEWLDKALIDGNFSGYEALEDELRERGYAISKSSIHRYGKEFEARIAALKIATEQAKAISESIPDDAGAMNDALIRLVQQKAFDVLMDLEKKGDANIKDVSIAIARLSRASVQQKKWMAEAREKAKSAADAIKKTAQKGGLSEDVIKQIEEQVLGIVR